MKRRITLVIVALIVALCTSTLWSGSPAGAKISPTSSPTGGGRILHK